MGDGGFDRVAQRTLCPAASTAMHKLSTLRSLSVLMMIVLRMTSTYLDEHDRPHLMAIIRSIMSKSRTAYFAEEILIISRSIRQNLIEFISEEYTTI